MSNLQHKGGTRAALVALASAVGLIPRQLYVITDESRLAIATSTSAFTDFAKLSEVGGGGAPTNIDGGNASSIAALNIDGGTA